MGVEGKIGGHSQIASCVHIRGDCKSKEVPFRDPFEDAAKPGHQTGSPLLNWKESILGRVLKDHIS